MRVPTTLILAGNQGRYWKAPSQQKAGFHGSSETLGRLCPVMNQRVTTWGWCAFYPWPPRGGSGSAAEDVAPPPGPEPRPRQQQRPELQTSRGVGRGWP